MKLRRKLSLNALFSTTIVVFIVAYAAISTFNRFQEGVEMLETQRDERMRSTIRNAKALFKIGEADLLTEQIRESINRREFDYFVVYKNGIPIHVEPADNPLARGNEFEERKRFLGKHLSDSSRSEISDSISDDTVLTIGRDQHLRTSKMKMLFETNLWWIVLRNCMIVIGIIAFAFFAHTRDLAALAREIRERGRLKA